MKYEITKFYRIKNVGMDPACGLYKSLLKRNQERGAEMLLQSITVYYVEILKDGNRAYLQGPVYFYNDFDFLVCVENASHSVLGAYCMTQSKHDDIGHIRSDLIEKG